MKTIAVIIPAYEAEDYVISCIKSIQNQELPDGYELDIRIGVDGCLKTAETINKKGISFYRSQENVGAYIMRNSLIALCPADYYCYFDADDIMNKNYMMKCIEKIESGAEIVLPAKINTDSELNNISGMKVEQGGSMIFSQSVIDSLGGFAPHRVAGDTDFIERAKMAGFKIHKINEALYYRRKHNKSLTLSKSTGMKSEYRKKVWQQMTERREQGNKYYKPEIVELEKVEPDENMGSNGLLPVYILIRTSRRPRYFARMMDSINKQTYQNIITIVHTDEPTDDYIEGDIIIRGERITHNPADGLTKLNAPYNLYCNRLLESIPEGDGWYYFLDDDDILSAPDVIEKFVKNSLEDHINVARVSRYGCLWPKNWKTDNRFHTESFFLHAKHKNLARWWGNRGGDHNYSYQICQQLPCNWIDGLISAQAQEGKGHGKRLDYKMSAQKIREMPPVYVLFTTRVRTPSDCRGREGEIKEVSYKRAIELEMRGKVIINPNKEQIEQKKQELLKKSNKIITFVLPEIPEFLEKQEA